MNNFMVLFYALFVHPVVFTLLILSCQQKCPRLSSRPIFIFIFLFLKKKKNSILSEWKHCYFIP